MRAPVCSVRNPGKKEPGVWSEREERTRVTGMELHRSRLVARVGQRGEECEEELRAGCDCLWPLVESQHQHPPSPFPLSQWLPEKQDCPGRAGCPQSVYLEFSRERTLSPATGLRGAPWARGVWWGQPGAE